MLMCEINNTKSITWMIFQEYCNLWIGWDRAKGKRRAVFDHNSIIGVLLIDDNKNWLLLPLFFYFPKGAVLKALWGNGLKSLFFNCEAWYFGKNPHS